MSLTFAFSSQESSVEVREESDSGVRAEVDFSSEGSDSSVDPVLFKRCVLLS